MASCDMCGKPATTKARIEGAVMGVCASCASFGTVLAPPKPAGNATPTQSRSVYAAPRQPSLGSMEADIVPDFGKRLRAARQKRGLNEEDAAKLLAITKNSLLHYESGKLVPDDAMARKLAKFYGISLLETT